MWSNLELSSTLFELGRARMPGGLAAEVVEVGIWSHGSWEEIRTLDHQLNQLGPVIGQGAKHPSQDFSLWSLPCRETWSGRGLRYQSELYSQGSIHHLRGEPSGKEGRDCTLDILLNCRYLWSSRIDRFPQPPDRPGQVEQLVGGGWCHGDPWPAEHGQWNEGGRQGKQSSLRCPRAPCCNGNVLCKRQPAQTDRLCSLSRAAIHAWVIWVVGGPRIECSAVHRNVAHLVCAPVLWEAISLPPSFSWAPSQAPCSARPSQSRPCAGQCFLPLVSPITRAPQLCWLGSQTSEVAGTSYSPSHLVCSPEDP